MWPPSRCRAAAWLKRAAMLRSTIGGFSGAAESKERRRRWQNTGSTGQAAEGKVIEQVKDPLEAFFANQQTAMQRAKLCKSARRYKRGARKKRSLRGPLSFMYVDEYGRRCNGARSVALICVRIGAAGSDRS